MNPLKKQLIKKVVKLSIVKSEAGILVVHIARLSDLDEKFKIYESYMKEAIELLNGIEKVETHYESSNIIIKYNAQRIVPGKIYNWMQVILGVALDNLSFIKQYGQIQTEYTVQKLKEVLIAKVKLYNT